MKALVAVVEYARLDRGQLSSQVPLQPPADGAELVMVSAPTVNSASQCTFVAVWKVPQ